jgi:hypothetical protein
VPAAIAPNAIWNGLKLVSSEKPTSCTPVKAWAEVVRFKNELARADGILIVTRGGRRRVGTSIQSPRPSALHDEPKTTVINRYCRSGCCNKFVAVSRQAFSFIQWETTIDSSLDDAAVRSDGIAKFIEIVEIYLDMSFR